jgi:four helix bundle suffix protein
MEDFKDWKLKEHGRTPTITDNQGQEKRISPGPSSVQVGACPCPSVLEAELGANGVLSLLNLCCFLLDRQIAAQAAAFEKEGGFTERLYRVRTANRGK